MRCPDCGQGTIYQARCRKKNGACITVYRCDVNKTAWAEELCREKEIPDYRAYIAAAASDG